MTQANGTANGYLSNAAGSAQQPPELKGVLDRFKYRLVTPMVGIEFPDAKVAEWLRAPDSDDLIRDLAITGAWKGRKKRARVGANRGKPRSLAARCRLLQRADGPDG